MLVSVTEWPLMSRESGPFWLLAAHHPLHRDWQCGTQQSGVEILLHSQRTPDTVLECDPLNAHTRIGRHTGILRYIQQCQNLNS